ncbi:hypothetical protein AX16_005806 [Volvariella volvacea WC 439]|nr:hypothetical protein AX16_005806 [Volvariella volvacea WC 439]
MLRAVKNYVLDRKSGIVRIAGTIGGFYLVKQYVVDRLHDAKEKMEEDQFARDSLQRRFRGTQENVSYTVLTLLPTLAEQVLEEMNVEALTQEIQRLSKERNAARSQLQHPSVPTHQQPQPSIHSQLQLPSQPHQSPNPNLLSSIELVQEQDARSDTGSAAPSTISGISATSASSSAVEVDGYSVSEFSNLGSASPEPPLARSLDSLAGSSVHVASGSGGEAAVDLSQSILSNASSGVTSSDSPYTGSSLSDSIPNLANATGRTSTRSKAELWNEVKIQTLTRTLTTLYSITLLSLLTTIQQTLLARHKYVFSVLERERDDRIKERIQSQLTMSNLLFGGFVGGFEDMLSGAEDDIGVVEETVTEDVENKFLTMSWWLLHVGWKDVKERVRRGVEEVFEGVSLKSKLASFDLQRLVRDVRRRVEYEVTFEGDEKRINFFSSLLPSTPETTQHVLVQGGYKPSTSSIPTDLEPYFLHSRLPSHPSSSLLPQSNTDSPYDTYTHSHSQSPQTYLDDPAFLDLLTETHHIITSEEFAYVLEVLLDQATEVLVSGLDKAVFKSSGGVAIPPPLASSSLSNLEGEEEVRIRLAGLLPGLAKWSKETLEGLPNVLVDNLLQLPQTEMLSAIVFAKFEEQFSDR